MKLSLLCAGLLILLMSGQSFGQCGMPPAQTQASPQASPQSSSTPQPSPQAQPSSTPQAATPAPSPRPSAPPAATAQPTPIMPAAEPMLSPQSPAQRGARAQRRPSRSTVTMSQGDARVILAIRNVLDAQQAAWNRGDIEGFMQGYERSPSTTFVSGDGVMRGWQTVLEQYKRTYDTREKMGTLVFSELEISTLSADAAVVVGHWQLVRSSDRMGGRFTLIMRRTPRGWRIVLDHTSSASSEASES